MYILYNKNNIVNNNLFYRNHAEITKRMMEKIQEQTEIVEVSIFIQIN